MYRNSLDLKPMHGPERRRPRLSGRFLWLFAILCLTAACTTPRGKIPRERWSAQPPIRLQVDDAELRAMLAPSRLFTLDSSTSGTVDGMVSVSFAKPVWSKRVSAGRTAATTLLLLPLGYAQVRFRQSVTIAASLRIQPPGAATACIQTSATASVVDRGLSQLPYGGEYRGAFAEAREIARHNCLIQASVALREYFIAHPPAHVALKESR